MNKAKTIVCAVMVLFLSSQTSFAYDEQKYHCFDESGETACKNDGVGKGY